MVVLTGLRLQNFKGFVDSRRARVARVTLVLGANSSGKSALLQPLLLAAQSVQSRSFGNLAPITMNGPFVELGDFSSIVHNHHSPTIVWISFDYTSELSRRRSIGLGRTPTDQVSYRVGVRYRKTPERIEIAEVQYSRPKSRTQLIRKGSSLEWRNVDGSDDGSRSDLPDWGDILGSVPRDVFARLLASPSEKELAQRQLPLEVSEESEYFVRSLQQLLSGVSHLAPYREAPQRFYLTTGTQRAPGGIEDIASQTRRLLATPPDASYIMRWLTKFNIATAIDARRLIEGLLMLRLTDSVTGIRSNFADFGFGTSQILPLLLIGASKQAAMGRRPTILIAHQPEVHLHPAAQGTLADFFVELTEGGSQAIVETHSEQLVKVIQRRVLDQTLSKDDVSILFVSKGSQGSRVQEIPLDDYGRFAVDLPQGFLDAGYAESLAFQKEIADRLSGRHS